MKSYNVRYFDAGGKLCRKLLVADSVRACETVISGEGSRFISAVEAEGKRVSNQLVRLNAAELVEFSSIMSSLLTAALSVRDALLMLQSIARKKKMRDLAGRLVSRIDRGESFADAAAYEGKGFPPLVLALIRIGERTGDLSRSFERIWYYAENRRKLVSALSNAMSYPVLVLTVMVFGSLGVGAYALPRLKDMFAGMGGTAADELGLALELAKTRVLLAALGMGLVLLLFFFALLARRQGGRGKLAVDTILLKLPLLGAFIRDANTLDFAFSMEALTSAGIPVNDALLESCSSLSNAAYAEAVSAVNSQIRKGVSLSVSFRNQRRLPGQLSQWLAVGERSGNVAAIFTQLKGFYEAIVAKWTARFLALMEPGISLLVGLFIIMLIFTFVVPILNVYGSML